MAKNANRPRRLSPEEIARRDTAKNIDRGQLGPRPEPPTGAAHLTPTRDTQAPSGHPAAQAAATDKAATSDQGPDQHQTPAAPEQPEQPERSATVDTPIKNRTDLTRTPSLHSLDNDPPGVSAYRILTTTPSLDADLRRAFLEAITPDGPIRDVAAVKPTVIDLVTEVPYVSTESDRHLMTVAMSFGRFCRSNSADGEFVPDRDLNEFTLNDFLNSEKAGLNPRTIDTYASQIRRLARRGAERRKGTRSPAAPPYGTKAQDAMWSAACSTDDTLAVDTRSLLSLTFGAGCRGDEVHLVRANNVDLVGRRVVLTVVRGHWVREVPVYGHYARHLLARSRELEPDDYLFRPNYSHRRNATSQLVSRMGARNSVFIGFKSTRARHSWLARALQAGVPFHAVCQVADVGKDSNLPTDLLPHLPHLSTIDGHRLFDRAYAQGQTQGQTAS